MPEMTIRLAYNVMKYTGINEKDVVIDYGCAKGYLVKALRILSCDAYGCDVSKYAIDRIDNDTKEYCYLIEDEPIPSVLMRKRPNWLISKDVFEHMAEKQVNELLEEIDKSSIVNMFHVIPLGDNGRFRISEYHLDKTHILIQDESWWIKKFNEYGWEGEIVHEVQGVKEKWTERGLCGDGFFKLRRKND